jgi:hypothetical protein
VLARRFARFLAGVFPGLELHGVAAAELSGTLIDLAEASADVFVVSRDDLDDKADLQTVLCEDYGAARGDLIIEIPDAGVPPMPVKLWRITRDTQPWPHADLIWDGEDEVITVPTPN